MVKALWSLASRDTFESPAPTHAGVPYRPSPVGRGTPPHADVWLPDGDGPHPSVLLIHGGGFVTGSRRMKPVRWLSGRLAQEGWALCSPSYRQVFRGGRLDDMIDDVETAARWWLDRTDEYRLDRSRVVLLGISAGATLSLRAAERMESGTFAHFVGIFGLYDFTSMGGLLKSLSGPLLLGSDTAAEASPQHRELLRTPTTMLHGTADSTVPYVQAVRMMEAREAAGLETQLLTYDGAEHAFLNITGTEVCDRATADLMALLRTLGQPPKP
jgi:acetyl esterase/lipase